MSLENKLLIAGGGILIGGILFFADPFQPENKSKVHGLHSEDIKIIKLLNKHTGYFDLNHERGVIQYKKSELPSPGQTAGKTYLLMINSNDEPIDTSGAGSFYRNIKLGYETFRSIGVKDENIYILQKNNSPKRKFGNADKKSIELAFSELEKRVSQNDLFIFYITQHGFNRDDAGSTFSLDKKNETGYKEIKGYLEKIKSNFTFAFLPPCQSYDGAMEICDYKTIVMTATGHEFNAIGGFSRNFFNAARRYGKNKNLKELFYEAVNDDAYTAPLFYENSVNKDSWKKEGLERIKNREWRKETPHLITPADPSKIYLNKE